jgi:glycerol kinase
LIDAMEPLSTLRVDGGAAVNDLLLQFQADILQLAVERPAVLETTALGAAYLAGLATGVFASPGEFSREVDRVFEPQMKPEIASRLRDRWTEAVGRTKGWEQ